MKTPASATKEQVIEIDEDGKVSIPQSDEYRRGWRDGMTDAAKIALKIKHNSSTRVDVLMSDWIRQQIKKARDAKKEQ